MGQLHYFSSATRDWAVEHADFRQPKVPKGFRLREVSSMEPRANAYVDDQQAWQRELTIITQLSLDIEPEVHDKGAQRLIDVVDIKGPEALFEDFRTFHNIPQDEFAVLRNEFRLAVQEKDGAHISDYS
jgi:hypothetical protein